SAAASVARPRAPRALPTAPTRRSCELSCAPQGGTRCWPVADSYGGGMAPNEKPQVDVPSDQPPSYQIALAHTDRGDTFKFGPGKGQVIRGWDEGVAGMKVGGRRRITIPPDLAYGQRAAPPV